MQISDELQKQVSKALGFGDLLIRDWTPGNLATYFNIKDGVLLEEGLSQGEGLRKIAKIVGIPIESANIVDSGLATETHKRLEQLRSEGTNVPWGENSIWYDAAIESLRRESKR